MFITQSVSTISSRIKLFLQVSSQLIRKSLHVLMFTVKVQHYNIKSILLLHNVHYPAYYCSLFTALTVYVHIYICIPVWSLFIVYVCLYHCCVYSAPTVIFPYSLFLTCGLSLVVTYIRCCFWPTFQKLKLAYQITSLCLSVCVCVCVPHK
jgi:hypothetical protein